MKKYLLPQNGNFYKANLHCHSNLSDGQLSPEEIKRQYMEKGYSIVAFTDHDILIPHPELAEENFLPLNGYEMEINDNNSVWPMVRTCHMCLIALEPDNLKQVCWHRDAYLFGNAVNHKDEVQFYEDEPDYIRSHTPECISDMMKKGRDHGFFVTYNHPSWSLEHYEDYTNYHNMHAMEIVNYSCQTIGFEEYNARVYDDMLRNGERIFCIAADDNHNHAAADSPKYDSFGGFIMIKADKLEYRTITKALEKGDFYASEGPKIKELWYEDGVLHIDCSDAEKILFTTAYRHTGNFFAKDAPLTAAEYKVPEDCGYVRVTVIDKNGKHANTNAYFMDELNK